MSVSQLSESAQNYLKVIFGLQEWFDEPVTPTVVAEKAGVKLSTASGAITKLRQQGLLEHSPYGAVTLTDTGRDYAVVMVRRHRLIETLLVQVLGYRWDQVHDEAERLEHAVSDFLIERVDELLGHPKRDPHGDPIPSAKGVFFMPESVQLSSISGVPTVTVERISDDDPALLQFFSDHKILVGAQLHISEGAPYSETLQVSADDSSNVVQLGPQATASIWVSLPESS